MYLECHNKGAREYEKAHTIKKLQHYVSTANTKNSNKFFNRCPFFFFLKSLVLLSIYFFFIIMKQINWHFSIDSNLDMTIEKVHKVAATFVDVKFKAKRLHWWNSSSIIQKGNKFPMTIPLKKKTLDLRFNKASF